MAPSRTIQTESPALPVRLRWLLRLSAAGLLATPLTGCAGGSDAGEPSAAAEPSVSVPGAGEASPAPVHDSELHPYRLVTVVEGLEHPWGMAFLPEGDILVTERPGRLRLVREGSLLPESVTGVPAVWAQGQGGLLDVALHPDFGSNRLVYLSFSKPGPGGTATTAVVRGELDGMALRNVEEIFEAEGWNGLRFHFGSRLAFDAAGHLFITVGDRGEMEEAQDPSNHKGTIVRLHDDGRIPADNPFAGGGEGALPEIYTWGNRNPQGLAVHPITGEVWANEHGPRGGDELNLLLPGRNYGWPAVSYGINYDGSTITEFTEMQGMEPPVHHWTPSIATSGLAIYSGDAFPEWRGNFFVGALAGGHLARVEMDGRRFLREERLLTEFNQRIRDVREGPDGYLYVLVDAPAGSMVRLEPAS